MSTPHPNNSRRLLMALAAGGLLSSAAWAQELPIPTTTPTPRSAPKKLGGGAGPEARHAGGSLADTVRGTQDAKPERKKSSLGTITNETLKKSEAGPPRKGHVILAPKDPVAPLSQIAPASEARDSSGRSESDWRASAASARKRIASAESEPEHIEELDAEF